MRKYPPCQKCGKPANPNHLRGNLHLYYGQIVHLLAKGQDASTIAFLLDMPYRQALTMVRYVQSRSPKQPYRTKLSILLEYMAEKNWSAALKLAARWGDLGIQRAAITRGADALRHPEFYKQLGKDPDALVAEGIAALRARYQKKGTK